MKDLSQERGAVSQFVKFNVLRGFGGYLRSHVSLAPGSRERPADHAHTHAHSHTLALSQAGTRTPTCRPCRPPPAPATASRLSSPHPDHGPPHQHPDSPHAPTAAPTTPAHPPSHAPPSANLALAPNPRLLTRAARPPEVLSRPLAGRLGGRPLASRLGAAPSRGAKARSHLWCGAKG